MKTRSTSGSCQGKMCSFFSQYSIKQSVASSSDLIQSKLIPFSKEASRIPCVQVYFVLHQFSYAIPRCHQHQNYLTYVYVCMCLYIYTCLALELSLGPKLYIAKSLSLYKELLIARAVPICMNQF